jgi:hypothetical protein
LREDERGERTRRGLRSACAKSAGAAPRERDAIPVHHEPFKARREDVKSFPSAAKDLRFVSVMNARAFHLR